MTNSDFEVRYPPLIVTSEMGPRGETGVQTHFNNFIDYLRQQDRSVEFVGPDEARIPYGHLRVANGALTRLIHIHKQSAYSGMRSLTFYATRAELRRRLNGLAAWCVYAQDPITARAAVSIRRLPSHRVVLAVHYNVSQAEEMANRGNLQRGNLFYRRILTQEKATLQAVDKVIVFSGFMRDQLIRHVGISSGFEVIPNTARAPDPTSSVICRDLIAIGSLEPRKNQEFLLRVLAEAKRRGQIYSLTLVGSGEDSEKLKALARDLGITAQTCFLGRQQNAASLLSAHKLLVHSALIENLPIALIESLAAGIPILAPAVGGIPEIFDDGIEGRFWSITDVDASTSILIQLMENNALRMRMAQSAKERYQSSFESARVFKSISDVVYGTLRGNLQA
jgi:glycosyltransferase involved in cell wall biosynthesis